MSSERTIFKEFGRVQRGKGAKWRSHPLIATFGPKEHNTACRGGLKMRRVLIKVWDIQFGKIGRTSVGEANQTSS